MTTNGCKALLTVKKGKIVHGIHRRCGERSQPSDNSVLG